MPSVPRKGSSVPPDEVFTAEPGYECNWSLLTMLCFEDEVEDEEDRLIKSKGENVQIEEKLLWTFGRAASLCQSTAICAKTGF